MNKAITRFTFLMLLAAALFGCSSKNRSNNAMISLLADVQKSENTATNFFATEAKIKVYDSLIQNGHLAESDLIDIKSLRANAYLNIGEEQKSVDAYDSLLKTIPIFELEARHNVLKGFAIANLRLGEKTNCLYSHNAASCIFPLNDEGVHGDKRGSNKAIEIYQQLMKMDTSDIESRWLLNIAYMTVGGYPQQVPAAWLIKNMGADTAAALIKPFTDVAMNVGLTSTNMAGGSIIDDFNNDGFLDIITSNWELGYGMHYFINNGDGSFTDVSEASGLKDITGGLNIMQTDYNNDGLKDIFVLRGAWKSSFGKEPNSLLKNNGDGTFTDVTQQAGLITFHPSQTATWADFNNDGWLDVFIGVETTDKDNYYPCELYINNKNGTFTNIADKAGCAIPAFVKGVTSADYNNDGLTDIFLSTMNGFKILLRNDGIQNGNVHFTDVSLQAGLTNNKIRTFPTWFWDYDNDGWPDILVCAYDFNKSLAWYAGAEALKMPMNNAGNIFLYHNKHDGTFEDVSTKAGLNKVAFAMGSNFGDIDNDGYPDIFLGTGNPLYQSLVPNKMFKNIGGERFVDVTASAHVGNLQKGHGVSFADMDNDGDEDIYIQMGGAFTGDVYMNSLFINPGQNNNRWINISLEGVTCNKIAIGAKIKATFTEDNKVRSVYSTVNSGGSFGCNPLTQHIGIGQATNVESIEITWPGSKTVQVFHNIKPGQCVKIKQGDNTLKEIKLKTFDFTHHKPMAIGCVPPVK